MRFAGLIFLALAACTSPQVWDQPTVTFVHDGTTWDIRRNGTFVSALWTDAPTFTPAAVVRARATQALEAFAGCPIVPESMVQYAAQVEAVMSCGP